MKLTAREGALLRMVFDLSRRHVTVSPTMASDALGLTCCARIVETRRSLEAKGLLWIDYVNRSRAILRLTDAGVARASRLKSQAIRGRAAKCRRPSPFLPKDVAPISEAPYQAERWRGQRMTGRYEDADVSGESLGPELPKVERHSGGSSAAQLCAEEGSE
jgi:hypothetical protein